MPLAIVRVACLPQVALRPLVLAHRFCLLYLFVAVVILLGCFFMSIRVLVSLIVISYLHAFCFRVALPYPGPTALPTFLVLSALPLPCADCIACRA